MYFGEYLKGAKFGQAYIKFIDNPSKGRYLNLRNVLLKDQDFDPYSDELTIACEHLENKQKGEAKKFLIAGIAKNLLLSPSAHATLSYVAKLEKDPSNHHLEDEIAQFCLEGLLATGNGTLHKPFLVTRTSDELDVLSCFGKTLKERITTFQNKKHIDVLTCHDNVQIYFDVTEINNKAISQTLCFA